MLIIVGFVIVIASIIVGYSLQGGVLALLFQPAELLVIAGAAIGAFMASQTKYSMGLILRSVKRIFGDPGTSKAKYLETLALLYALFTKMHREGVISIENDVEKPESSTIFNKYPAIAKNSVTVNFIGDTLRVYLTTGAPEDIDNLMESDMRIMHEEELIPAHSISHMAESLPGMGIVACVLGVVLTMSKINEPPEV
ncbi:MAG: motility-associated protein, partial [Bilophila sp.]